MKHLLLTTLLLLPLALRAQTVALCWVALPDTLCPYFTAEQRFQLLSSAQQGEYPERDNLLGGKSHIDTLDLKAGYLRVSLTASMTQELWYGGDSVLTLRNTYCTPRCTELERRYDPATFRLLSREIRTFRPDSTELIPYF